jgi:hypothetical protein
MRPQRTALIALAIVTGLAVESEAQSAGCRASDASTTRILRYVKDFATLDDPARDSVGLAGVDTATIVTEADSASCARVAQSLDSAFTTVATQSTSLVIVRAGSRFFAWAPTTNPSQPSRLIHVVDSLFTYRESIVAF